MAIPVTVTPYTRGGTQYYRYESPYVGKRYASGSFAAEGRTPEQAKAEAIRKAAYRLNLPISEFEGHETETTGAATEQRLAEAEQSRANLAKLHEQREALRQGFSGQFTPYTEQVATRPIGAPELSRQTYEKQVMLQSPTAQWSSEQSFQEKVKEVSPTLEPGKVTTFRGQVLQPTIPEAPYVYESPFGKDIIKPEGFPGAAKPISTDWTAAQRNVFAEQPKRSGTFTVIEGRLAQKYSFIEGQADFGKSMFGVPQGKPEQGATYRKDWFGGYTKINKPRTKIVSEEQFKAIGTSDIIAPILIPSGAFAPTSVLKGASLGFKAPSFENIAKEQKIVFKSFMKSESAELMIKKQRSQSIQILESPKESQVKAIPVIDLSKVGVMMKPQYEIPKKTAKASRAGAFSDNEPMVIRTGLRAYIRPTEGGVYKSPNLLAQYKQNLKVGITTQKTATRVIINPGLLAANKPFQIADTQQISNSVIRQTTGMLSQRSDTTQLSKKIQRQITRQNAQQKQISKQITPLIQISDQAFDIQQITKQLTPQKTQTRTQPEKIKIPKTKPPIIKVPSLGFGIGKRGGKRGRRNKSIAAWDVYNWTLGADIFETKKKKRRK